MSEGLTQTHCLKHYLQSGRIYDCPPAGLARQVGKGKEKAVSVVQSAPQPTPPMLSIDFGPGRLVAFQAPRLLSGPQRTAVFAPLTGCPRMTRLPEPGRIALIKRHHPQNQTSSRGIIPRHHPVGSQPFSAIPSMMTAPLRSMPSASRHLLNIIRPLIV